MTDIHSSPWFFDGPFIEIDGKHRSKRNAWWIFPWQTVSMLNNQMLWYSNHHVSWVNPLFNGDFPWQTVSHHHGTQRDNEIHGLFAFGFHPNSTSLGLGYKHYSLPHRKNNRRKPRRFSGYVYEYLNGSIH